jgi:hypothetical protein
MKTTLFEIGIVLILLLLTGPKINGNDTLKYDVSINYYIDLSDTYGNGKLLTGEFSVTKEWYGIEISFGHFQSQAVFVYQVYAEDLEMEINIPFDEMAIMQLGSLSAKVKPVQGKKITTDLIIGLTLGEAKNSRFNSVQYSYSTIDNKFNYLYKDYKLVTETHLGYHLGVNISFFPIRKIGVQLNSRILQLNHGGTFFFLGGGTCFRF